MSAASSEAPAEQRSPFVWAQVIAAERAELVAAGSPAAMVVAFDAVVAELRRQEQRILDGLAQATTLVVDAWCREHAEALQTMPAMFVQGLIVRAAVAYVYGHGVMTPAPVDGAAGGGPLSLREAVPEHLWPDVRGAVAGYERLLAALDRPGR